MEPGIGPEDEEAYARRMWEEMQRRSHGQPQVTPAAAETWAKADSAQSRRQKAADQAAERSRKILEDEQAKDRAWRQAVQQVCHMHCLYRSIQSQSGSDPLPQQDLPVKVGLP